MSKVTKINFDTDTVCPSCGRQGTSIGENGVVGICMECAAEKLEQKMACKIGPKVIKQIEWMIHDLFEAHQNDMDAAYKTTGDEPFKVGISVKMEPGDKGDVEIETAISFTTGKVKDKTTGIANEAQGELF